MTIVLPNDRLAMQFPQPSIVIRTRRNKVCRVSTERTVPDPALVAGERALELEGLRGLGVRLYLTRNGNHRLEIFNFPYLGCVVCGAGCEVLDVW